MQQIFDEIVACTDEFSKNHLTEECAQTFRKMVAILCRKRPSPLLKGDLKNWAAGIIYAIGSINFLFDSGKKSKLNIDTLCSFFGLVKSTISTKSKQIKAQFKMTPFDVNWTVPSKMDSNPLVWNILINGFCVDVRFLPLEIQEMAYEKGVIPYIPGPRPSIKGKE